MELIKQLIDLALHLDKHLAELTATYGTWMYAILALIVFCETGLVVTPFLPGDSLLFAAGSLAAIGELNPHILFGLLAVCAVVGDTVNYSLGSYFGEKVFTPDARILKTEYLEMTHRFYEKHGRKTIIFARFVPIVRTFAPFVAGAGKMDYRHFITSNVVGGLLWTSSFIYGGYFFGNLPIVKKNFTLVIFAIIFLSVVPGVIEVVKARRAQQAEKNASSG